ncbi:MAG: extracellular solute-binding protein, partial [Treponema sp.]|nr:extracellular solute-binding protein [Treponema sp.]
MAVKPADRLILAVALVAIGTAAAVRLGTGRKQQTPPAREPLQLAIRIAGEDGLNPEDMESLITGYPLQPGKNPQQGSAPVPLASPASSAPEMPETPRVPDSDTGAAETPDAQVNIIINAENTTPDILITGDRSLAAGIRAGLYLPLDRYYQASRQDSPQTSLPESPAFPAAGTWALPLVSDMDVLIYNISLLREAGFDRPPRTRDDFLSYARTIKAQEEKNQTPGRAGRYSLALGLSPQDPQSLGRDIYPWFYSSGLPLVQDGRPEFGGRDYTGTLDFFSTLNSEGLIMPGSFNATGADRVQDFVRGSVAMMIVSTRELRTIREKMENGAVGITLIPHAGSYTGKPVLGLSTWYAGISTASPHPDQAWTLLEYLREQSVSLAETLALV